MKDETLKALKGSITKWKRIVNGKGKDVGNTNCPLCTLFPMCAGCPVADRADEDGCTNTPWEKWSLHQTNFHNLRPVFWGGSFSIVGKCRTCKKLAREELEFLQSLLPKEEGQ